VDAASDVYLIDTWNDRVLKLSAGFGEQTVPPFTGIESPGAVAVDTEGNVYVTDGSDRVVKLTAGSNDQTVLPSTVLSGPTDVTVDRAGNVYVVDSSGFGRVVKLEAS
jgi:serine/threonine protein kinase, bacterial